MSANSEWLHYGGIKSFAACCVNVYMPDCPASAACSTVVLQALFFFSMLQAPVGQLPAVQLSATAQHFADLLC